MITEEAAQSADAFALPHENVGEFGIEPGMRVADFGAGSGHYALAMAAATQNSGEVYVIDIQKDLLTRIKNQAHARGFNNIEVIWGDLERVGASKIADEHLDLVLVSNLFFQLESKESAFREAMRVLKPRGRLVVIDWTESFGGLGPIQKHVFPEKTAIAMAEACGFKRAQSFSAGAHHYGLIFIKPHAI